jgi:hypothetical protein
MVSTWYATIIIEDIIRHTAQAYCTMGNLFRITTEHLPNRQQYQQGYMMLSEGYILQSYS